MCRRWLNYPQARPSTAHPPSYALEIDVFEKWMILLLGFITMVGSWILR